MRYGSVRMKLLFDRIRDVLYDSVIFFTLQEEEARYLLLVHHQQRRPAHPISASLPDLCHPIASRFPRDKCSGRVPKSRKNKAMSWSRRNLGERNWYKLWRTGTFDLF